MRADRAVLDGEIVAVDANGRPSFQALQHRAAHPGYAIAYYAFDILHLAGEDLTGATLQERRAKLPEVLNDSGVFYRSRWRATPRVMRRCRSLAGRSIAKRKADSRTRRGTANRMAPVEARRQKELVIAFPAGTNGVEPFSWLLRGRDRGLAGR